MPDLVDKLKLDVVSPRHPLPGLDLAHKKLQAIDAALTSINTKMSGAGTGAVFRRTASQLKAAISQLPKAATASQLAKHLGLDVRDFQRFAENRAHAIREAVRKGTAKAGAERTLPFIGAQQRMVSVPKAVKFVEDYQAQVLKRVKTPTDAFQRMFGPGMTVPSGKLSGKGATLPLVVPTARIVATLGPGVIPLMVPPGQVAGLGATGKGGAPGKGGKGPAGGASGVTFTPAGGGATGTVTRVVTTPKSITKRELISAGKSIDRIDKDLSGVFETIRATENLTAGQREALSRQVSQIKRGLATARGKFHRDPGMMARAYREAAESMEGLVSGRGGRQLEGLGLGTTTDRLRLQAEQFRSQALIHEGKRTAVLQRMDNQFRTFHEKRLADFQKSMARESERVRKLHAKQQQAMNKALRTPPPVPPEAMAGGGAGMVPVGGGGRGGGGGRSHRTLTPGQAGIPRPFSHFTPKGFGMNILNVAGWASAVGALYGVIGLAGQAMSTVMEIGEQTARLEQVFRGVGGTAEQLADDVLRLASAYGRNADEAMESAIQWSRLGLNRVQVNEAVRVSLMAANVAELTAAESTDFLTAIMQGYGLQVTDLESRLAMLNNTTNKYNVTNKDLLQGLSKVAQLANDMGIPFAELQAIIGATVGKTGQTGSEIGNSLKRVLTRMTRPDIQEFLREGFGVDTMLPGGKEVKSSSEVLRELAVVWQGLTDKQRQSLAVTVAGAHQVNRFMAVLNNWPAAQKLAADGFLNLNSAEEENARITASLKKQWQGLTTELSRLVVAAANAENLGGLSASGRLTETIRGIGTAVRLLNDLQRGGSGIRAFNHPVLQLIGSPKMTMLRQVNRALTDTGDRISAANKAIQAEFGKAAGLDINARLLRSQAEALPISRPEERGDFRMLLPAGEQRDRFDALLKENRLKEAAAILDKESQSQAKESAEVLAKANELRSDMLKNMDAKLTRLKEEGAAQKKILELEANIASVQDQQEQEKDEQHRQSKKFQVLMQEGLQQLAAQELALRNISDLYGMMPAQSFTEKLHQQLAILKEQEVVLSQTADKLEEKLGLEDPSALRAREQLSQLKAEIAALSGRGAAAGGLDRIQRGFTRAGIESQGFAVGATPAEQFLAREAALQRELRAIQKISQERALLESELTRQVQFEVDLNRTREQIQERIVELRGQELQLISEAIREFERSLLTAGPGDILKKLAANQLGQGITPGGFFALSPDLRETTLQLRGGRGAADARLERSLLRGRELSLGDESDLRVEGADRVRAAMEEMRSGMDQSARAAILFSGSLMTAAEALERVPGLVDRIQQAVDPFFPNPRFSRPVNPGTAGVGGAAGRAVDPFFPE